MQVKDAMTSILLSVGPSHTLRDVARLMAAKRVGAAIVLDPDSPGPGIITERDILLSLGTGENPDEELVSQHRTDHVVYAAPDWSLEEAAVAMLNAHFRHLVVIDHGEVTGILSIRDIVRCWTEDGAICTVPAPVYAGTPAIVAH